MGITSKNITHLRVSVLKLVLRMKIRLALSIRTDLESAVDEIKQELGNEDYDFILFSAKPSYSWSELVMSFQELGKKFFGFHALHSFSNIKIIEGLVACGIKFERGGKVKLFNAEDFDQSTLESTAEYLNSNKEALHIMIPSMDYKVGGFLDMLSKRLSYFPVDNVVGGISSGHTIGGELITYRFTPDGVHKRGFSIISFEGVDFSYEISLGFRPYGAVYTVSRAEGYRLYKVDEGMNVAKILENMLNHFPMDDVRPLWYAPLLFLDETEGQVAIARTPLKIGKNYVDFAGPIKEGTHFKFSFATYEDILGEDKKKALELKKNFGKPEFAINFSCTARQYVLEDKAQREQEIYTSILESPTFGFFTYGEIAPSMNKSKLMLYNETSIILALREK